MMLLCCLWGLLSAIDNPIAFKSVLAYTLRSGLQGQQIELLARVSTDWYRQSPLIGQKSITFASADNRDLLTFQHMTRDLKQTPEEILKNFPIPIYPVGSPDTLSKIVLTQMLQTKWDRPWGLVKADTFHCRHQGRTLLDIVRRTYFMGPHMVCAVQLVKELKHDTAKLEKSFLEDTIHNMDQTLESICTIEYDDTDNGL